MFTHSPLKKSLQQPRGGYYRNLKCNRRCQALDAIICQLQPDLANVCNLRNNAPNKFALKFRPNKLMRCWRRSNLPVLAQNTFSHLPFSVHKLLSVFQRLCTFLARNIFSNAHLIERRQSRIICGYWTELIIWKQQNGEKIPQSFK